MANISGSNSLYGSSQNKGIGGLVSGLNTDELVEQMAARTKAKINKQYQAKTSVMYKQSAYREISKSLLDFQDKYFSLSSSSSIMNKKFFEAYSVKSSSDSINVSGDMDNIKDFKINNVSSVASKANFSSSKKVSNQYINSDSDIPLSSAKIAGESITFQVESMKDGKKVYTDYTIQIDKNFGEVRDSDDPADKNEITLSKIADQLNEQLVKQEGLWIKDADGNPIKDSNGKCQSSINYIATNGKLVMVGTVNDKLTTVTAVGKNIAETLHIEAGSTLTSKDAINVADVKTNFDDIFKNGYMTFDYNGRQKTITFDIPTGLSDDEKVKYVGEHIQKELDKAFGQGRIKVNYSEQLGTKTDGTSYVKTGLSFDTTGENNLLGIPSLSSGISNILDIKASTYNRVNKTEPVGEAGLGTTLNVIGLTDQKGLPIYEEDAEGKPIYVQDTNPDGSPKFDANGKPVYIQDTNSDGTPMVDANGDPVYKKKQLEGYSLVVNGKKFNFDKSSSLSKIMTTINNDPEAGVLITHSSTTDTFTVTATETGSHRGVLVEDVEGGNLAFALFGKATSAEPIKTSDVTTTDSTTTVGGEPRGVTNISINNNMKYNDTIKVGDQIYEIVRAGESASPGHKALVVGDDGSGNILGTDIATELNAGLVAEYGSGSVVLSGNNIELISKDQSSVVVESFKPKTSTNAVTSSDLGLNGDGKMETDITISNPINYGDTIKIGDKVYQIVKPGEAADKGYIAIMAKETKDANGIVTGLDTNDIASRIKTSIGSNATVVGNKITFTSADATPVRAESFKPNTTTPTGDYIITNGKDSVLSVEVNGQQMEIIRNTNTFTIDGINVELGNKATEAKDVTFEVTSKVEDVVKRVKDFVDDYNKVLVLMNNKTSEKPDRDYPPLIPDQKEDMKEADIKSWDEQAKKGILFGDMNINNALFDLRESSTDAVKGVQFTLAQIGLGPKASDTSGQIEFNEEMFREKFAEDPNGVKALFTQSESEEITKEEKAKGISARGISYRMKEVLQKNVGNYGNTGILIEEAGYDTGMTVDANFMTEEIKEYDESLKELKIKYQAEKERYWRKFTELEKLMSNLNSQSSWLTDQLG